MNKATKILLGVVVVGGIVFSSCGSTPKAPLMVEGQGKWRNVTGLVTHIPVTADLDVKSQKVQGEYRAEGEGDGLIKMCKAQALVNALETSGADVLINPIYSVEQKGNKIVVRVSGYPGFYKNFRAATIKDKDLLEIKPSVLSNEESNVIYKENK